MVQDHKSHPGFYSRLFLVPKPNNKWRPVIDLSALNRHLIFPHFQMKTSTSIRNSLQKCEWVTSIDLTDAYYHLPLKRKFHSGFEGIQGNSEFSSDSSVPVFRRLVESGSSKLLCLRKSINLVNLVIFLGFLPNFPKSLWFQLRIFNFWAKCTICFRDWFSHLRKDFFQDRQFLIYRNKVSKAVDVFDRPTAGYNVTSSFKPVKGSSIAVGTQSKLEVV